MKERGQCEQNAGNEELVLCGQEMQHTTWGGKGAAAVLKSEHPPHLGCGLAYVPVVVRDIEYPDHHHDIGGHDGHREGG